MKFLHNRRRTGVLALLSVLLGAAALMFGIGGAGADTCQTTTGSLGDATLYVPGVIGVDLDTEHVGSSRDPGFWACAVPPNQGAGVGIRDNNGSTTGRQLEATTCGTLLGGCTTVEDTGDEVDPATSVNQLGGGDGTGAWAGTGDGGGCVYINGAPDCPILPNRTIAGVTVAEGDLPTVEPTTTVSPGTPCAVGVNNTCPGLRVRSQDDPDTATVDIDLGITGVTQDQILSFGCVQVNTTCP